MGVVIQRFEEHKQTLGKEAPRWRPVKTGGKSVRSTLKNLRKVEEEKYGFESTVEGERIKRVAHLGVGEGEGWSCGHW